MEFIVNEKLTMPTAALALDVLFRLTAFTGQTADWLWRPLLFVWELNIVDVHQQLAELVLSDFNPLNEWINQMRFYNELHRFLRYLIFPPLDLLEVNDVVPRRAIAVPIKVKFIAREAHKLHVAEIFEKLASFCRSHCFAESWPSATQVLMHVSVVKRKISCFHCLREFVFQFACM